MHESTFETTTPPKGREYKTREKRNGRLISSLVDFLFNEAYQDYSTRNTIKGSAIPCSTKKNNSQASDQSVLSICSSPYSNFHIMKMFLILVRSHLGRIGHSFRFSVRIVIRLRRSVSDVLRLRH